ncbi:hypothetical protein DESC_460131 [Desulfosarcina cetonica]|nr:hypothetical protein DESC_460131 [Desulfosarcina cetonica]
MKEGIDAIDIPSGMGMNLLGLGSNRLTATIQSKAYGRGKLVAQNRFFDKGPDTQRERLLLVDGLTEAGANDHRQVRAGGHDPAGQFLAGHVGHGLVGDHQVEVLGIRPENLQGFEAAGPTDDLVSQLQQQFRRHVDQHGLVVNQENALVPAGYGLLRRNRHDGRLAGTGKIDLEGAAHAGFAVDIDAAAQCPDDPMNHGQTQAGALALGLGGEIGVEDAFARFRRHADAVVGDRDDRIGTRFQLGDRSGERSRQVDIGQSDFQDPAPFLHGVSGVGANIHDDLVDLGLVGNHDAGLFMDVVPDLDGRR